jgi:hypothetical protein
MTDINGSYCFKDGGGGAGGALSGAAGKGGAGGHAGTGGTGGQAGAGVAGATGSGGAVVLPVCTATPANRWIGQFSTIDSGTVKGPTYTVNSSGFDIVGDTLGPGAANVGVAFTFSPCVDASASQFTGVSFSISGSVSSSAACTPVFQVDDSERSGGGTAGPGISISNLSTTTPQTVQVPFSTSGGTPAGPIDAQHVSVLVWGVSIAPGATCSIQFSIGNLTFY